MKLKPRLSIKRVLVFLILIITLASFAYVGSVQESTTVSFYFPQAVSSSFNGSVIINANGSVEANGFFSLGNVDKSGVLSLDGTTYVLNEQIIGYLKIERSDATLNGNYLPVGGNESVKCSFGVFNANNLTLENLRTNITCLAVSINDAKNITICNGIFSDAATGIDPLNTYNLTVKDIRFTSQGTTNFFIDAYPCNYGMNICNNVVCYSGSTKGYPIIMQGNGIKLTNNTIESTSSVQSSGITLLTASNVNVTGAKFIGDFAYGFNLIDDNNISISSSNLSATYRPIFACGSSNVSIINDTMPVVNGSNCLLVNSSNNVTIFNSDFISPFEFSDISDIKICNSSQITFSNVKVTGGTLSLMGDKSINLENSTFENQTFCAVKFGGVTSGVSVASSFFNCSGVGIFFICGSSASGVAISGNTFLDQGTAVDFPSSGSDQYSAITIQNNNFYSTGEVRTGVCMHTSSSLNVNGLTISGNTFMNITCPINLRVQDGNNFAIDNNTIINSRGVYVNAPLKGLEFVNIQGNTIIDSNRYGIFLTGGIEANISHNFVNNSGVTSSTIYSSNPVIWVRCTTPSSIYDNSLTLPKGSLQEGILVCYSDFDTVQASTIYNGGYGVALCYAGNFSVVNNQVYGAATGLIAGKNTYNFSYNDNLLTNSSTSLSVSYAKNGVFHSNTVMNSSKLSVAVSNSSDLLFYHNNFLDGQFNNVTCSASTGISWNLSLPVGGNYWSNYAGTGIDGIGTTPYPVVNAALDHYPLTRKWTPYTVSFTETGLQPGSQWSVSLGSITLESTTQVIVFPQDAAENISSNFTVSPALGSLPAEGSGTLELNGTNQVIQIQFVPYESRVVFAETGNPQNSPWAVSIAGFVETSTSPQLNFSLQNGSYAYHVSSNAGFSFTGSVTVSGLTTVNVKFPAYYYLNVSEEGLPSGTPWTILLSGIEYNTTSGYILIPLVNGNYSLAAIGPVGVSVNLQSSLAQIHNSNESLLVVFGKQVTQTRSGVTSYTLAFDENGKPSSSKWQVSLNTLTQSSAASSISYTVVNGTYNYSITSSVGYATTGSVRVNGSNISVTITFPAVYVVTVNETGLPAGVYWAFYVDGIAYNTSGNSLQIDLVSGNFSVSASGPSGYSVTLSHPFLVVNSNSVQFNVSFASLNKPSSTVKTSPGIIYDALAIGTVAGLITGTVGYVVVNRLRSARKNK